jgi:hypothetical protein
MSFRPIDLRALGEAQTEPLDEPLPELIWIDTAALVVDETYQRPLNNQSIKSIRDIAAAFSWARFAPIVVAAVGDGRYAIIDGQHRAHAAALRGLSRVPAMVSHAAVAKQAEAFVAINSKQIRVTRHAVLRARIASGDPIALRMVENVAAAGCRLMTINASTMHKKPGQLYTIGVIEDLTRAGHDYAIRAGLAALLAFDSTSVANFADEVLDPLLRAVAHSKLFDNVDLILSVLHRNKPWIVLARADGYAAKHGKPKAVARREAFIALFNKELLNRASAQT